MALENNSGESESIRRIRQKTAGGYKGRLPQYRLFKSRGIARAQLNNKVYYFPGKFGSEESVAAYQGWLREHLGVGEPDPKSLTVAQLCVEFLKAGEARWGKGTRTELYNFRCSVKLWIASHASTKVADFGAKQLREFGQNLAAASTHKKDYINSTIGRIRRIIKWGVGEGVCETVHLADLYAVAGIKDYQILPKNRSRKIAPVDWQRVQLTLPYLPPTVAQMVLFQWYTGTRSQSLCSARCEQFAEKGGVVVWEPIHKTQSLGHELRLPLGPNAELIYRARVAAVTRGSLFLSVLGKEYTPNGYRQAVTKACKKAGVPHWHPHQLRHAMGQRVKDQYGIEASQAVLGHAKLDATQVYAHSHFELAKRIVQEVG